MKKPVIIEAEALEPAAQTVSEAPQVPDPDLPQNTAMQHATRLASTRAGPLTRLALWALGGLISLSISLTAWDFVTGLLARNWILGQLALGLGAIVALALLVWILREVTAVIRLRRTDDLHAQASDPATHTDRPTALAVTKRLLALYANREELRLASADLRDQMPQILDADALMAQTETSLMRPLDAQARQEVEAAARQVAAVTALVPLALADVAVALAANIRMVRRIATIYAGRAGTVGSLRLLRAVAQHLIATGAVAVGDDMIGSLAGGGALAKVSRRFGEGVINGTLTARVGVAAMEVCRPMPFRALKRPRVTSLIKRALTGLFSSS